MKIRKLDNRAIGGVAAVLIAVIVVAGFGVALFGYSTNWKFQVGPSAPPTTGVAKGTYEIQCFAFDSLSPTTARTMLTDVQVTYYSYIGGVWNQLGSAPLVATGISPITLTGNENGYMYTVVTTAAGYYLDAAKTAAQNNLMTYIGYENVVTTTGLPQYVFKVNLNGIVPSTRATADVTLNFYLITTSTFTMGIAQSSTVNVTGDAGALNMTYLGWYMVAPTINTGTFIRQITLLTNDTSTATQTLYKQNIPGVGYVNGGTFTVQPQSAGILYTWNAPTNPLTGAIDLGSAIPWLYSSSIVNKFDLTTNVQTSLIAVAHDAWTITVYTLSPAGAGGTVTEQMSIDYATPTT